MSTPNPFGGLMNPDPGIPPGTGQLNPDALRRQTREERMQRIQGLIDNFTFSLGSGLTASANAPGGARNRTLAGVGAALNAPAVLQQAQQAFALKKQEEAARAAEEQQRLALTAKQIAETGRHDLATEGPDPYTIGNTRFNPDNSIAAQVTPPTPPKPDYTIGNQRFSSQTNQPIATGTPTVKTPDRANYQSEKVLYQGKLTDVLRDPDPQSPTAGHVFVATQNGLQDITGQTTPYTAPPSVATTDNRMDKSYQYNDSALNKIGDPVSQALTRFGNLRQTVNQNTPQADALIAPELLTVMAGGQGSGLRMNEAEISRIVGGRSNLESLKAALNKWQTDPTKALSVTPAQRQQIQALMDDVSTKLQAKQDILDEARQQLIDADSVDAHRRIVAEAKRKLTLIDQGKPIVPIPSGAEIVPGAGVPHWTIGPNGVPFRTPGK